MFKAILFFSFCFFHFALSAQVRDKQTINSGWQFVLNDNADISSTQNTQWQKINLPHTWNALDIVDDTLGYHHGIGWYKKELFIPTTYQNKHLELLFEGACNRATVYVNGKIAGSHTGGFTHFAINLDGLVKFGERNELLVKVDNGKYLQDTVPPFSGDFNVMGGIYRDVWLVATNKVHFARNYGSSAVYFQTPVVSQDLSIYFISGLVQSMEQGLSVDYVLKDGTIPVQSGGGEIGIDSKGFRLNGKVPNPKLWSPDSPHVYTLVVQLKNEKGELLDEIQQNVGFRWFGINDKQEFLLNGKPYKLKGASRHQDYERMGNALTDAMHVRDIELMKDMGCNFLRIAHYPQDPAIYDACDRLGLIAWSEIPVVDKAVHNETFIENSRLMMHEMIWQNYYHPSVAIWGYHNEVRNLDSATVENARMLDTIARTLDPYRLTAMAFESNVDAPYFKSNPLLKDILNIADINGYNVYQGWYRGRHQNIASFLDTLHNYNPKKPILLSEYGAGSLINIHAYNTSLFDFSEEYQAQFHESYVRAGMQRPWMTGFGIWNFIDFQRDGREDVKPNINKKGMVTTDRQPKDVYYFYKSQWSKEPFVYIAGKHWTERIAVAGKNKTVSIPLVVYSNQKHLALFENGKPIATEVSDNGVFNFTVTAKPVNNLFECKTATDSFTDVLNIRYHFIDTTSFSKSFPLYKLNFNTGQSRTFFTDPKSKEQWIPDKPYTVGTWGYVGGEIWNTWPSAAWNGIREGIHKPIANTDNEPLFQTFVQDLTSWKADVPAGKYRVTLLLSEPFTDNQRDKKERVMNITLNGQLWMSQLNLAKEYGVQAAVILDKEIIVKEGEGIYVNFNATSGKTLLNGMSVEKL